VAAGGRIIDELRARLGDIEVVLDPVSAIPRTQGGKFRAVVCNVGEAEIGQSSRRAAVAGDR
jgi:hypothetical protein